jgi:hypothetical protein
MCVRIWSSMPFVVTPKKTRLFFTFRHSINAWLIRNVLLATNQLWDIHGGPGLPVRKHWFLFVHSCIRPSHHRPHLPFLTEFFSRMINPFPSFQTYDEATKGGGWKLKNQEGSLNKDSKDIPVLYSNHYSYKIMYVDKKTPVKLCRCYVRLNERGIAIPAFKYFLLMNEANVAWKI